MAPEMAPRKYKRDARLRPRQLLARNEHVPVVQALPVPHPWLINPGCQRGKGLRILKTKTPDQLRA